MAAFAPVSSWTPSWPAPSAPSFCAHVCHPSTAVPFTTTTTAILDHSVGSDLNAKAKPPPKRRAHAANARKSNAITAAVNAHSYLTESVSSIHSRLGIISDWSDEPAQSHPHVPPPSSSSVTLADTDLSDVVPVTAAEDSNDQMGSMPWDTTGGSIHTMSLLDRRFQVVRKRQQLLARSYEECRRITELFSKTFYLGTSLLSPTKRKAVWAIYTWCRRTDDIVDGPRVTQRSAMLRSALSEWEVRLNEIFAGRARDALDLAMVDAISQFQEISPTPFRDMIKGMIMDVEQDRFETFDDLYLYCYRVAGTVGLMTLPIMGTASPDENAPLTDRQRLTRAVEPAVALGIALQLTNILRDVGEDRLRGRIYLPLEDLRRFNYTEQDLFNCVLDQRYINLMKFEVARARRFFKQAKTGIQYLHPDSRFPVQASLDMYSQILDVLEENGYDNFNRRAHITKTRKLLSLPGSLMRIKEDAKWKPVLTAVEFLLGTQSKL